MVVFPQSVSQRPISRRQALLAGAVGLGAVELGAFGQFAGRWLQAAATQPAALSARPKSVILIFNCGAPSHLDLWDPKPNATDTVRGPFHTISTNVPGIQVSELLPRMATRADKLAIVRTLHHQHTQHNSGMYWSIVGRPYRIDNTLINPSRADHPSFGTLVGWLSQRESQRNGAPPYVITPSPHCDSFQYITPGQFGGCLGPRFDPFVVNADPNAKQFKVPNLGRLIEVPAERLADRRHLLSQLERASAADCTASRDYQTNRAEALALMTTGRAGEAFDLSREPNHVRDRYGRHPWGQSHLLARRLIEAGTRFVTTVNGPSIVWDTHKDNFNLLKNQLVPPMEQAFAALLDDLAERGLLETTLVIWMGDFGRTPVINKDAGRDHWPDCYSMVLAGCGVPGGQVIGESDSTAAFPLHRPVSPADIHATVFRLLGFDSRQITYQSADGRPIPLSDGTPVPELL